MADEPPTNQRPKRKRSARVQSLTVEIALEAHILRFLRDRGHHHLIEACKGTFSDVAFDRSLRLTYRLEELINKHLLQVSIISKKPMANLITIGKSMTNFQRERLSNPPNPGSAHLQSFQAYPNRAPPTGWTGSNRQFFVRKSFQKYAKFSATQATVPQQLTSAASHPMTQQNAYKRHHPESNLSQATNTSDMLTTDITLGATQATPVNLAPAYDSDLTDFEDA